MHGQISDLWFNGVWGVAANNRNRIVLSTVDRGATWRMPSGASVSRAWQPKLGTGASLRGSTFGLNSINRNTIYCALGNTVYRSRDEGETWSAFSTIPQCTKVNAFIVSPKDTSVFLAAVAGTIAKRVVRSGNHGQDWADVLTHDFGDYGIPLEYDHDRPDTMYFGGDADGLYRSTDAGASWTPWSVTLTPSLDNKFRSPCDIVVVPDSGNVILVGDGVTGSGAGEFWKSTDWGQSFIRKDIRPGSEVPGMACSRLCNSVSFGTNWYSGGVQRSTDYGETWPTVHGANSAWGTDIARDDPNVMIFGVYSGGQTYLSLDGGLSFITTPITGSNYSFFLRDRGLILAEQSGGIYKMLFNYLYIPSNTQAVTVTSPNGGELWSGGSVHDITWTSTNLALAHVEYRKSPGDPWQLVAEVPGYQKRYAWTLPHDATSGASVRVRDAWDGDPEDSSNSDFTIGLAQIAETPASLDFATHEAGSQTLLPITLQNPGTAGLTITSITAASGAYRPGRTTLTLLPGLSDTVGVTFQPSAPGSYPDTLVITSNAYNQPVVRVRLAGEATASVGVDEASPTAFALWQNRPNPFARATLIRYALPAAVDMSLEVFSLQGRRVASLARGVQGPGVYTVAFGPGVPTTTGERVETMPAGVYFYRFQAGTFSSTRKMLLLR
jgi:hypothetical protein